MMIEKGWLFTGLPKQFDAGVLHRNDGETLVLIAVEVNREVFVETLDGGEIENSRWEVVAEDGLQAYANHLEKVEGWDLPFLEWKFIRDPVPDENGRDNTMFHQVLQVLHYHCGGKYAADRRKPTRRKPARQRAPARARKETVLTPNGAHKLPNLSLRRDADPVRNATMLAAEHRGWATIDQEGALTVVAKSGMTAVSAQLRNGILLPGDGENPLDPRARPSEPSKWFTEVLHRAQLEILVEDGERKLDGLERAQAAKRRQLSEMQDASSLSEDSQSFR